MTAKSFDDVNGNGITRDNDLDTSVTSTTIGGGPTLGIATAIVYQGTSAFGRRVNSANTDHGFFLNTGTARDTTTATYRYFLWKGWISDYGNLNAPGLSARIGSATTAYHRWIMGDDGTIESDGFVYPTAGGWVIKPIHVTLRAWLDTTTGNPSETLMDEIGFTADINNTSNGENLWGDSLDWIENGFHAVGGDSTDPDITFDDFVAEDEGSASTNFDRVGLWRTVEGIIYWYGTNVVGRTYAGTVTASEFTDSFKTLVCPGGYVDAGWNVLDFDIGNANTVVALDNVTMIGRGRSGLKRYFDSTTSASNGDVNTTTDAIEYTGHGLKTGDQVLYDREGNTGYVTGGAANGESELVTGTTGEYYYIIRDDDDNFGLASSFANAVAGTRIALTAQADEIHSVQRTPDTRFDLTQTGSTGTLTLTSCNITSARIITINTNGSINSTNIISCGQLAINNGTVDSCAITEPTTPRGEAFIQCTATQVENITNTSFQGNSDDRGPGHAIEITSASAATTYDLDNIDFTGYASYSGTDFPFDGSSGSIVSSNQITITGHPYTTGEAVYYDSNGGTAITGLTDGNLYYIEVIDANTVEIHSSKGNALASGTPISLTAAGAETEHRFDSANAAIWNNAGVSFTLGILNGGTGTSIRNTGAVEVTVQNNVSVVVQGCAQGSSVIIDATETAGTITAGDRILEALADANGEVSTGFNYEGAFDPSGLDVICRVRNQGFPNAAIADDGGVFTDETTEANSTNNNDMNLMPATPVVNDAYYFGDSEQFSQLKLQVGTAGVGTSPVIIWEYWNGSSWASLTGVTDGTDSFQNSGTNIVSWTIPGGWSTTTVNSQGPYFYVRARLSSGDYATTSPLGRWVKLDITRYLPFSQDRTILSAGLTVIVTQREDTISEF